MPAPDGITCPDWEADPNGHPKRCKHYNSNGSCQLPTHVLCVEWLKRNPVDAVATRANAGAAGAATALPPAAAADADATAPSALALLAAPDPPPRPGGPVLDPSLAPDGGLALTPPEPRAPRSAIPQGSAADAARAAWAALVPGADPLPELDAVGLGWVAAKAIDPLEVESLERACDEVHLVSPELGDVYLVRARTGADRLELTFREAAILRLMVDQFPGARVVQVRRPPAKDGAE